MGELRAWEPGEPRPAPPPPNAWLRPPAGSERPRQAAGRARRCPPGDRSPPSRRWAVPARPVTGRPRGCGSGRHRQPRRRVVHQPRRLDQPCRDVAYGRAARTGSSRTDPRSSTGASPKTASTSSWASPRSTWWGSSSELGLTWSRDGEPLLPIGTLYDPFITRALEPWSFGIYAGGQSILVGTPSGVTLAPEGGAHQSVITPSVGLEQPQLHGLGAGVRPGPGVGAVVRLGPPGLARTGGPPISG